jgi:hypothetical protein
LEEKLVRLRESTDENLVGLKGIKMIKEQSVSLILSLMCLSSGFFTSSLVQAQKTMSGSVIAHGRELTHYAVQGDTLSQLSQKYTGTMHHWQKIGELNKIYNDRQIPIGTIITIPTHLLPEEEQSATVTALAGVVTEKRKNGTEVEIKVGSVLNEGSQISTGKNGFLSFVLSDQSQVSIPSNSQVLLAKLRTVKYIDSPRIEIKLLNGKVESKVIPMTQNKGRFQVTSPLAVAGVRGTHFRVGTSGESIANEVLTGEVGVGKLDKPNSLILPAGQGNIVSNAGVGKAIELLNAPNLSEEFYLQGKSKAQFTVNSVPAALAYRGQIALDAKAQNVIAETKVETQNSSSTLKFDTLSDGAYYLRLTAIDKHGLEGMPSIFPITIKANPPAPFAVQPKSKARGESVEFVWTESSSVQSYRLQVSSRADFKQLLVDQTDLKGSQFVSGQLGLGQYYWRIASVEEKNGRKNQGPFSDAYAFSVLPAQTMNAVNEDDESVIGFSWPSEPEQIFLIQVAKDTQFKHLVFEKESKQANLNLPRPDEGTYYIRVRPTDKDGFVGPFSAPQKFIVKLGWTSSDGKAIRASGAAIRTNN